MTAITDLQAATLRAQLAGHMDEHLRLLDQLDGPARAGYRTLVSAAFFEAARQRFPEGTSPADVIEYVGDIRSRLEGAADSIDPRIAERLILAVFTDEQIDDIDAVTNFRTQLLLLGALIAGENPGEARLDQFLARARKLADQWLS
ncbi:MAG: hypothetical protein M3Y33_14130 [Actinomycetota bacterium]|nr:hypothetical protein [Actinomycetota bacterium]